MAEENNGPTILVTGGAGYIGTHCIIELLHKDYNVVAIDNFTNSVKGENGMPKSLQKVSEMTGKSIKFFDVDICDKTSLRKVFSNNKIDCVLHIAALKSVSESFESPLKYYSVNVAGSIHLVEVMDEFKVKKIVFSSSATVFGEPEYLPIDEIHPTGKCINPYGRTKYFFEEFLKDLNNSNKSGDDLAWNVICLRYFNPVGAHSSGMIGEDPLGVPYNLVPFIAQVCVGRRDKLTVFGTDYPTPDGTCVRDYIHIMDLATGHVAALKKMFATESESGPKKSEFKVYNLSLGNGSSVLDIIKAFEKVTGMKIPVEYQGRRQGDVPALYAKCDLAKEELGWTASRNLDEMIQDVWRWQSENPEGYL